jgi:hypothetical protein
VRVGRRVGGTESWPCPIAFSAIRLNGIRLSGSADRELVVHLYISPLLYIFAAVATVTNPDPFTAKFIENFKL